MSKHRISSPIILFLRDIGRGRKVVPSLRYADLISARTQPPPTIPGGPYDKTTGIYYYARDGRREVKPPIEVPLAKQIPSGSEEKAVKQKYISPGKPLQWR